MLDGNIVVMIDATHKTPEVRTWISLGCWANDLLRKPYLIIYLLLKAGFWLKHIKVLYVIERKYRSVLIGKNAYLKKKKFQHFI